MQRREQIDFLGIGAHGAGSTWLWHWLSKHPEIGFLKEGAGRGIPGKEAHYWNRFPDQPLDWYLDQFDWSRRVVGEITPAYARFEPGLVRRIHTAFPAAQILYIVRDPLARTWSDVRKRVRKASPWHRRRLSWMIEQGAREKVAIRNDYAGTTARWAEVCGRDRVHVFLFSDIAEKPRQMLARICNILGVDGRHYDTVGDELLGSRVNTGLDKACPPDFIKWFEQQDITPFGQQLSTIEELGCLERLPAQHEPVAAIGNDTTQRQATVR